MKSNDETAHSLEAEAAAIGRYLIGRPIDATAVNLYVRAVRGGVAPLDPRDWRLLARAIRHPWLLGFIDGAASLREPHGSLRQRLVLMFAILETSPLYCDRFLPAPASWLQALPVAGAAARAAVRGVLGIVVVGLLR